MPANQIWTGPLDRVSVGTPLPSFCTTIDHPTLVLHLGQKFNLFSAKFVNSMSVGRRDGTPNATKLLTDIVSLLSVRLFQGRGELLPGRHCWIVYRYSPYLVTDVSLVYSSCDSLT